MVSDDAATSTFVFLTCQAGVERLCKARMAERWPDFRFAFSRPGFLTYKLPSDGPRPGFDLENAFVRTCGVNLGRVDGAPTAEAIGPLLEDKTFHRLHLWRRDPRPVGDHFEPFVDAEMNETARSLAKALGDRVTRRPGNSVAEAGERVLDCVLVDPDRWWIGWHEARSPHGSWPGGTPPLEVPENMISRAYLKMHEAIAWSRLPLRASDWCVEIGSAPGGAAQALLEHQLQVIGVDPAEMAPELTSNPNFHHIRKRGRDVRRRDFARARWLFTDCNVTPQQTLDTLQDIVTHDATNIRGMLITLKMPDWRLVDELPGYLERIRGWGFGYVRPRHLTFNRQELCVVAMRNKAMRRF